MQVNFESLEHDPQYIAWIECDPEEINKVLEIFPVEKYDILVGIKSNYNPIDCDNYTLNNPPEPTWGLDVRLKTK